VSELLGVQSNAETSLIKGLLGILSDPKRNPDLFTEVSRSIDKHLWVVEPHLRSNRSQKLPFADPGANIRCVETRG
jgi:hypothetical protein